MTDWVMQIKTAWNKTREGVIETGRLLLAAKEALPHGKFTEMIELDLPFAERTAERLMCIARDPRLSKPTHGTALPTSWRTLYDISRLSDEALARGIKEGIIRSDMERKDLIPLFEPLRNSEDPIEGENDLDEPIEAEDGDESLGRIYFADPQISTKEMNAVHLSLKNRQLTNAGIVRQFEERFQEFCGGGIAVAVSSCAAALYLCLRAKGIGPGDEVILPALTHPALANALDLVGAKPVFVDSAIESGSMDNRLIEAKVTSRIKLISPLHFLGQPAYMRSIENICRKHPGIEILEDCALAIHTQHHGVHVGLMGMAGCFSFYPAKHMTTGEGGMVLTNNAEFAERIRCLRSFGYGDDREAEIHIPSLNFRMTEMQAAMGIEQLKRLPKFLAQRVTNASLIKEMLSEFNPTGGNYAVSVFVPDGIDRDKLRYRLIQNKIETSVYYRPQHLGHRLAWYRKKYGEQENYPVAERFSERTIALSVGPHLSERDIRGVCETFRDCLEGDTDENRAYRRSRVHRASSGT